MSDLDLQLEAIESALERQDYRPGMWSRFVAAAADASRADLRDVAERSSRVSVSLHRRHGRPEVSLGVGATLGVIAAALGFLLVELGRDRGGFPLLAGAVLLIVALQPLVKTAVGLLLGIRFSGVYLRGVEPRVKLRYGTYLTAPKGSRIVFHLAGTIGSPIGALWAWRRAADTTPEGAILAAAFWLLILIQILTSLLGLTGTGRRLARISSGGVAGREIRSAMAAKRR